MPFVDYRLLYNYNSITPKPHKHLSTHIHLYLRGLHIRGTASSHCAKYITHQDNNGFSVIRQGVYCTSIIGNTGQHKIHAWAFGENSYH
jgi:hypothetical protein